MKQALLVNGNRIVVSKGQTLKWSETGKRLELWQEKPLTLLKYWNRSRVLIVDME